MGSVKLCGHRINYIPRSEAKSLTSVNFGCGWRKNTFSLKYCSICILPFLEKSVERFLQSHHPRLLIGFLLGGLLTQSKKLLCMPGSPPYVSSSGRVILLHLQLGAFKCTWWRKVKKPDLLDSKDPNIATLPFLHLGSSCKVGNAFSYIGSLLAYKYDVA